MTTKTPEQPTPIELTPDQSQRIASLVGDYDASTDRADFTPSTLLTFRLTPATPVEELATEVLYRSETIDYEERRPVLQALGSYARRFSKLSEAEREKYTYAIPGISAFSQHIGAMRNQIQSFDRKNLELDKVTQTQRFLSFVVLEQLADVNEALPEAG